MTTASRVLDAVDQLDSALNQCRVENSDPKREHDDDFDTFKKVQQLVVDATDSVSGDATTGATTAMEAELESWNESSTAFQTPNGTEREQDDPADSAMQPAAVTATDPDTGQRRYVSPQDFDLLKVIGMGAFGKVLQVRNRTTQQVLAMKVISKRLLRRKGDGMISNIQAERNILKRVRHPFVVSMHCSFQSREKLFIIMDFLAGGELFLRLGREGIFLEKTAAFYLAEIILALDHLHTLGVLHRDLKP
jgi:serine/threonine protein kinase